MSDNVNPLDMSDEEFMNLPMEDDNTQVNSESEEPKQENTDVNTDVSNEPESSTEEPVKEDETTSDTGSELTGQEDSTNIQSVNTRTGSSSQVTTEDKSESPKVNYEEFYQKVMAPFKANNKMISLRNADEAIQLMQQGANYTQKMQKIGPYRKALLMLEKNGLLDENQLSFLIDVKNKNPEAIKKFLKDNNIDPLEIDTTQEPNYKAGTNIISDKEANFRSAMNDLTSSGPEGVHTLQVLTDTWDNQSKAYLFDHPEAFADLNIQMQNGTYKLITDEVDRLRTLGQIPSNVSFIDAYMAVGNQMLAQKQQQIAQQQKTQQVAQSRPASKGQSTLSNGNKIRQAGISSNSPKQPRKSGNMINPLAMSDEDFEKQFGNRYY
jgi:hypothetical protein